MKIFKSNPIQSNPIQSNPIQSNPILAKTVLILASLAFSSVALANCPNFTGDAKLKEENDWYSGCVKELNSNAFIVKYNSIFRIVNAQTERITQGYYSHYEKLNDDLYKFSKVSTPYWISKNQETLYAYYNATTGKLVEKPEREYQFDLGDGKSYTHKNAGYLGSGWFGDDRKGEKFGLLWLADDDGKKAFMDTQGNILSGFEFDRMRVTTDERGHHAAYKDGYWIFLDRKTFKQALPTQYEEADSFWDGKAKVKLKTDDKYPLRVEIDNTGKILTPRYSLTDFRKKLEQGDDVYYKTADDSGVGMIFEIKGNLVQVQTKESQCSQRDYKGNCQNYIENQVGKWVKKSEVYPTNHFD